MYRSWRSLFSRLTGYLPGNSCIICQPVQYSSPTSQYSRTRNHAFARALHVLSVQLERGESVRRDWISRCASFSPRSAGGTLTGRHETECGQRLKPVTPSQRPILAFAALSVCVVCFLQGWKDWRVKKVIRRQRSPWTHHGQGKRGICEWIVEKASGWHQKDIWV